MKIHRGFIILEPEKVKKTPVTKKATKRNKVDKDFIDDDDDDDNVPKKKKSKGNYFTLKIKQMKMKIRIFNFLNFIFYIA